MRELFVHFCLNGKIICSYDRKNEFAGERDETIKLIASEKGVAPEKIEVYVGYEDGEVYNPVAIGSRKNSAECKRKRLSDASVHELVTELRSRNDVIGVQVWQMEDLINEFEERGIFDPTPCQINSAAVKAAPLLESCDNGWNVLEQAVEVAIRKECGGENDG